MISLCFILSITSHSEAAFKGDTELLKYIAEAYEVSCEKIRSWEGTASVDISEVHLGQEEAIKKGWKRHVETDFLYDYDSDAMRWISTFEDTTYNQGQEDRQKPVDFSGMAKTKQGFQMFYDKSNEEGFRTLEILPIDQVNRTENGLTFDPSYVWRHLHPNLTGVLRNWYKERDNISSGHSIHRQGDIVTVKSVLPASALPGGSPDQEIINVLVFDLSKGCNLLKFEALSPVTDVRWDLEYEEIGGAFVIKTISKEHKIKSPGNEYSKYFKANLNNKMVNQPVEPSEFEYDKIGLRPGDKIIDRMVGELIYDWKKDYRVEDAPFATSSQEDVKSDLLDKNETSEESETVIEDVQKTPDPTDNSRGDQNIVIPSHKFWIIIPVLFIIIGILFFYVKLKKGKV